MSESARRRYNKSKRAAEWRAARMRPEPPTRPRIDVPEIEIPTWTTEQASAELRELES